MAVDYQALEDEILNDPLVLGYAGKSDYEISQMMNDPGLSGETLFRSYTPAEEIVAAIIRADYDALDDPGRSYLGQVVLKSAKVKTGDATLRGQLADLFGVGTTTRTNLTAVASRPASRSEILFGENSSVNDQDVATALRG